MADFFHSLNQVLHILHNNTSKIECVLFFLFISAADAANVHHGIVAGLGHSDRDLPCRKLLHRKSSVSQSVVFPGVYSAESFTSPRLKVWVLQHRFRKEKRALIDLCLEDIDFREQFLNEYMLQKYPILTKFEQLFHFVHIQNTDKQLFQQEEKQKKPPPFGSGQLCIITRIFL